jgi:hypothetical protein
VLIRTEYSSLRQGLVGAWCPSLGATGYTLLDRSMRGNNGALTNMGGQANWLASGSGLSIPLDGSNDYIDCGAITKYALTTELTISAWVYPTSTAAGNRSRILDADAGTSNNFSCALKIGTNSPFTDVSAFISSNGSTFAETTTSTGVVAAGAWYHVAAAWSSGGGIAVYVNGVRPGTVTATTITGSIYQGASVVELGRLRSYGGIYGSHRFDDIRVYNRALTLSEIRLLASRRGIGLSPLPDRAAALPRRLSVNVGGTWRDADAYLNVGGEWKLSEAKINVGGVWK